MADADTDTTVIEKTTPTPAPIKGDRDTTPLEIPFAQRFPLTPAPPGKNLSDLLKEPTEDPRYQKALAGEQTALQAKIEADDRTARQLEEHSAVDRARMERANQQISFDVSELKHTRWDADQQIAARSTSLWEAFGSPAFLISMLGSAFSAMPMNTALQAGGAAINAIHQGDMDSYHRAFDAWKDNTELVIKRIDLEQKEFNNLKDLYKTDMEDFHNKMEIHAEKFRNERLKALLGAGLDKEALDTMESMTTLKTSLEKSYNEQITNEARRQYITNSYEWKHGDWEGIIRKITEVDAALAEARYGGKMSGDAHLWSIAQKQFAGDPQKQADWVANEKAKSRTGGAPTLTPDAIKRIAGQVRGGNMQALTGMYRNPANIVAIHDEISKQDEAAGIDPEQSATQINQKIAGFVGQKAGASSLGRRAALIIGASAGALAAAPRVLETSRNVSRTNYPDINAILLAAREKRGDPNVIRFGIALQTFITNFAAVRGQGNANLTDRARKEAGENLQKRWSEGQIEAAVDQIEREMRSEMLGAQNAMELWETKQDPFSEQGGGGLSTGPTIRYDSQGNRITSPGGR